MVEAVVLTCTEAEREKLFMELYKNAFPLVAKYVRRMNGSFEEAKDIFQDALVIYYEKILEEKSFHNSEKAYILGIAKYLWIKKYKGNLENIPLDQSEVEMALLAENYEKPVTGKLMQFLETAGKKCMEILQAFYYEKLSTEEMAEAFGFSGVRSMTVQKYKCLEKVRNKIKEKTLAYEDFLE